MAKNKKKKSSSRMPHSTPKFVISKAQFDTGCTIARKTMQVLGFDPALFDMFTKKQKHTLLDIEIPVPLFRVKTGNHVPRKYLNAVRTAMMDFMRTNYIDKEIQLTFMEFYTYGLPFLCSVRVRSKMGWFTDEQEKTFIREMNEKYVLACRASASWLTTLFSTVWFELSFYSQINFRTYGFEYTSDVPAPKKLIGAAIIRYIFELTSYENESIYFVYKNIKRKAFSVLVGSTFLETPPASFITHQQLYPDSKFSMNYTIYVQSHAIHRFKERVDVVDAPHRNYLINVALINRQKVVKGANGYPLISCLLLDAALGYFPFTIQGDKLFILSFLPVVSSITPEGEKLYSILRLSKDELIYLGMDKLSFFITIDFDQIPVLKNALIDAGLWQLKQELEKGEDDDDVKNTIIDKKRTQFVKNFFQKTEERMKMLVENEIPITESSEEWI
jgi:hypothetical protein